jgi:hypothetical protein
MLKMSEFRSTGGSSTLIECRLRSNGRARDAMHENAQKTPTTFLSR